jgi:hypothetical protein
MAAFDDDVDPAVILDPGAYDTEWTATKAVNPTIQDSSRYYSMGWFKSSN